MARGSINKLYKGGRGWEYKQGMQIGLFSIEGGCQEKGGGRLHIES